MCIIALSTSCGHSEGEISKKKIEQLKKDREITKRSYEMRIKDSINEQLKREIKELKNKSTSEN